MGVRKRVALLQSFCLCCVVAASHAYALQPSQSPPLTLASSSDRFSLASHADLLCDPAGNIPLEAAQTGAYVVLQGNMQTAGECHGYWIRFGLQASRIPPGGWVLQLSRGWRHANLYFEQDGRISVLNSGMALPPSERAVASSYLLFPLPLESGHASTFYLHLVGDTSQYGDARTVEAVVQRFDTNLSERRDVLFGQGIYGGIILALVLYNLILYFAIRERTYLYYSLYVLTFGSVWISRTGFLFQFLWPHHSLVESESQYYLVALAIIFSSLFVRHFLATRQQSQWVDRALSVIVYFTAALMAARILGMVEITTLPLAVDGLVTTVFFAFVGVLFLRRGYRSARFFLVAWTLQLIGNALYIFAFLRFIPFNFITYNAAQIGSGVESILLAFALADKVNLLKREQEEKQSQYTRELRKQVEQRTGELSTAVEKLKTASVTDPLTGLSNRRHVSSAIQPWIAELQRARIRKSPGVPRRYLAICLADLDHFKLVNDALGHAVGDKVLQAAADTLRQNVRATAVLARWGGEEFLIIDHVTQPLEELLMAERLRRSILDAAIDLETGRPLSLSLGVVRYPFSENYPDLLAWDHCLVLADHALYRAKNAGRNRWQCYRANEDALRGAIQAHGAEEVRRLLRLHAAEAFNLGLIEVIEEVASDVEVF